jgi:hypothetical protein
MFNKYKAFNKDLKTLKDNILNVTSAVKLIHLLTKLKDYSA